MACPIAPNADRVNGNPCPDGGARHPSERGIGQWLRGRNRL